MKYTYKRVLLVLSFVLIISVGAKAQTLTSITPNASLPNTSLTTTITSQGNAFLPGSPFGGNDLRLEQSGGGLTIYSDNGSVNYTDANDITANWFIPNNAPAGFYDLQADVDDGTGTGNFITLYLYSAFQVYPVVSLSQTHVNTTCGNSNGSVSLTVDTGTPPYTYNWSNGAITQNVSNLAQGGYTVTVTDFNGSTASLTVNVGNTNGPTVSLFSSVKAICTSATGTLNVTITGGTAPYAYLWSNNATTKNIASVKAGSYTLTVTDKNNCDNFLTTAVGDTNALNITYSLHKPACGYNSGSVSIQSNGQPPYSYIWSTGSTASTAAGLSSGIYIVTVTDAHGCIQSQTINATASFSYYIYTSSVLANCSNNGSIIATVSGGTPPYSYAWSNGETTSTDVGLGTGYYYVTVTDSDGCQRTGYNSIYVTCVNIITGTIFNDSNGNCLFDAGDSPLSGYTVEAVRSDGSVYFGNTDANGRYVITIQEAGTYKVEVPGSYDACGNKQLSSCGNSTITFTGTGGDTAYDNFTSYISSGSFDLAMHPGWVPAKPGFVKKYWVYYYNLAPTNYTGTVTIIFKYDSNLKFIDSVAPHPVNDTIAHTLTWTVNGALSSNNGWTYLPFYMRLDTSVSITYELQNTYTILPTIGDCDSSNNVMYLPDLISGSRDPNEKDVSPHGVIGDADSVLTYTIHFQNNGTDTTNFIIVTDTLSPYVDPATVVNLASNPSYSDFYISGKGILKWVFNPAYLTDSATNVNASKGFITFSIKKRDSLPTGTEISNKAYIYFDYNSAVITNTVKDTVLSSITTLASSVTGNGIYVNAYPNPFAESTTFEVNGISGSYDFALTNVLGQTMNTLNQVSSSHFTLNRNNLVAGIYFYSIKVKGKEVANGKLVVANE